MAIYGARDAIAAGVAAPGGTQRPESEEVDARAPMTNTAALLGFALSNTVMLWWVLRAGMSW